LRQSIEPSGLTITGAAAALGVRLNTLSELVSGKRGISPEMAVSLSKGFRWYKRRLACATVRERVLPDTVNGMASSIRTLWQGIQNKDNIYIHPNDKPIIDLFPNAFNCHFPPPAFIGDVENARVILLMNAGGYDSSTTPGEFSTSLDVKEHLDWLRGDREEPPSKLSSYYTERNYHKWIRTKEAVLVNAFPYRSPVEGKGKLKQIANRLPSAEERRRWLQEEVLPDAKAGLRFVVFMNWTLWDFKEKDIPVSANVHVSKAPVLKDLEPRTHDAIASFLKLV
jgi:hypothetical protein